MDKTVYIRVPCDLGWNSSILAKFLEKEIEKRITPAAYYNVIQVCGVQKLEETYSYVEYEVDLQYRHIDLSDIEF